MIRMNLENLSNIFEPEIQNKLQNHEFPGFAMAVVEDGLEIYSYGAGHRDIVNKKPFDVNTLARFGSCSKSFTSLAILLLEDRELLNVQDPIRQYLPIDQEQSSEPITVHHLMTHTSGLPFVELENQGYTRKEFFLKTEKVVQQSRADLGEHIYSNLNFSILQLLIEQVTDRPFGQIIRELILQPLGMHRTLILYDEEASSLDENLSIPYEIKNGENQTSQFIKSKWGFDEYVNGPGFLVSSCHEMLRFLDMVLHDGILDGTQVINPSIIDKLLSRYVKDEALSEALNLNAYFSYALGIKENYKGLTFMNASGLIEGGVSLIGLYYEAQVAFACVWNAIGTSSLFIYDLWDRVLETDQIFQNLND